MTTRQCFQALGLEDDATPAEVKDAWRRLNSRLHPDRGGDAAEHRAARTAYEEALARAEVCPTCVGKGKIDKQHGWSVMTVVCSYCRGSGRRPEEKG